MNPIIRFITFSLFLITNANAADILSKNITVYKNPECDCCVKWIEYLQSYGYQVDQQNVRDVYKIKKKLGVPLELSACHTAVIDGYVVEGHITHRDIKRLLLFKPKVKGIAVPGMPIGTPGMERGDKKEPYKVFTFDEDGNSEVFVEH